MVDILIICIDRDDDLGYKAGIKSPVIGRGGNLDAAMQLALSDPEDSDINTIFGGIQIYDELKSQGQDVEIVMICGSQNVGIQSDLIIAEQLDAILERINAKKAIVVSDGAEDESVLPIIESRIKVDAVKRVVVKQSQNIESTYYIIKQLFENPKISKTFFIPIGLAFVIYAISLLAGYPQGAVIAITAFVGIYMLIRGFELDDVMGDFTENLKRLFYGGKMSFVTYISAVILGFIGIIQGLANIWELEPQGILMIVITFINASVWWIVAGGLFGVIGKIVDAYLGKGGAGHYLVLPFFISSAGLLLWAGSGYILTLKEYGFTAGALIHLVIYIIFAIIMALIGVRLSTYMKKSEKNKASR
ncbi:MAG: DUF373 family protein [Methanosarcinales archaeon Met12]|nr:MAG: DUF373 family protein [Methanosarcinales archaeon Met12]